MIEIILIIICMYLIFKHIEIDNKKCKWDFDKINIDNGNIIYEIRTKCNNFLVLSEENYIDYNYCPYCGKKIDIYIEQDYHSLPPKEKYKVNLNIKNIKKASPPNYNIDNNENKYEK